MSESTRRLEVRLKDPNPLIRKILENLQEDTKNQSQKTQNKLQQALDSINRYPLPLTSGKECAILQGFGPALCQYIDQVFKNQASSSNSQTNKQYEKQIKNVVKSVTRTTKPRKVAKTKNINVLKPKESIPIKMAGGSFKVYLLVDMAETKMDQTRAYLEERKIYHEVRKLSIGDFIWIARDSEGNELVLPYIIERKRMDDLDASIRDGRFREQKHRIRNCGLPHVLYLFENLDQDVFSVPLDSLKQAIVNTQVHEDFYIVRTAHHKDSMRFLENLTKFLIRKYAQKTLGNKRNLSEGTEEFDTVCLMEFSEIYKDSARNAQLTIKELFIQQLLQLHSLTLEKAIAIVTKYPTPKSLLDAYKNCSDKTERQQLLSNIPFGPLMRAIGPKISLELYEFYESIF